MTPLGFVKRHLYKLRGDITPFQPQPVQICNFQREPWAHDSPLIATHSWQTELVHNTARKAKQGRYDIS